MAEFKDYTVPVTATYSVSVFSDKMLFEVEDDAIETIETMLKKVDVDEINTHHITEAHELFRGYLIKIDTDMVLNITGASNIKDAYCVAEKLVKRVEMPSGITLVGTRTTELSA